LPIFIYAPLYLVSIPSPPSLPLLRHLLLVTDNKGLPYIFVLVMLNCCFVVLPLLCSAAVDAAASSFVKFVVFAVSPFTHSPLVDTCSWLIKTLAFDFLLTKKRSVAICKLQQANFEF
jgi:hypothetical protein